LLGRLLLPLGGGLTDAWQLACLPARSQWREAFEPTGPAVHEVGAPGEGSVFTVRLPGGANT